MTHLKAILFTTCMLAGSAAAERAPAGPDFQNTRTPAADRAHAASDGAAQLEPLDVIPFAFDSAALDSVDRIQLEQAARWLATHHKHRVVIAGHTDAAGGFDYNTDLAARRARAVRDQLVALGVPRDRVIVAVYGEANPRSHDPYAAANRVAVLYATTLPAADVAHQTLPDGARLISWVVAPASPDRSPGVLELMNETRGQSSNLKL